MTFTAPTFVDAYLTNGAYGYPQGAKRKHDPTVLMVIHITGNRNTAAAGNTRGEVSFMGRKMVAGGHYNSAHSYIARDGTVFRCVPLAFPAWNNGDLLKPDTSNAGVRSLVQGARKGINPNELCYREVECTGYPGSFPVTDQQIESAAFLIARDSLTTGLSINRDTVLTHADINSVNRANCAFTPGQREKQMTKLIARAKEIKAEIKNPLPPDPPPPPPPPPPTDPCADCVSQLDVANGQIDDLQSQVDDLTAKLGQIEVIAAPPAP